MPKKRILLIDNEPDFASLLKCNLENTGVYEVREESMVSREEAKGQKDVIGGHPFIAKPASPEEAMLSIEEHLPK
jgi:hypothetical protein